MFWDRPQKAKVIVLICGLHQCVACEKLIGAFRRLCKLKRYQSLKLKITFDEPGARYGPLITPRMYPTVIVLKNGKTVLGWEGFATMAPTEISDTIVTEALEAALALTMEGGAN